MDTVPSPYLGSSWKRQPFEDSTTHKSKLTIIKKGKVDSHCCWCCHWNDLVPSVSPTKENKVTSFEQNGRRHPPGNRILIQIRWILLLHTRLQCCIRLIGLKHVATQMKTDKLTKFCGIDRWWNFSANSTLRRGVIWDLAQSARKIFQSARKYLHEAQPSVISNFSVRFESQISNHTSPQGDVCY